MRRAERLLRSLLLAGFLLPGAATGYEPQVHQLLTFYAAKVLNRCVEDSEVAPLTPLQVRFIATSNMGLANTNFLVRFFRWTYFDAAGRDDRQFLWLINTRFTDHFQEVAEEVHTTRDAAERYQELGRIVSYVQLVSSPSRAVPVYSARFWRWSFGDRFDGYSVSEQTLEAALGEDCSFLTELPESYRAVLDDVANDTLTAVRSPIGGLPTTWESFWQPGEKAGDFGDYGPAGNSFGRQVEFPCNLDREERCVLIEDDPLYIQFALERRLSAIRGTARAMYLHQYLHVEPPLPDSVAEYRQPATLSTRSGCYLHITMAAIDFFCSADDRHRVILLVDLLEKAGQEVTLRCEPVVDPTRPCLVACTRRALREPWIGALFERTSPLVAIRLDDGPLPGACARVIDMQAWPARSADRKVGTLVQWLEHGDAAPSRRRSGTGHQPAAAARAGDSRTTQQRSRMPSKDPNLLGGLTILGLLVLGAAMLSVTATEQQDAAPSRSDLQIAIPPPSGSDVHSGDVHSGDVHSGSDLPIANLPAGESGLRMTNLPDNRDLEIAPTAKIAPTAEVAPPENAVPPHADALRHLCDSQTLEAALAWAGTLSWKQRRRVTDEPCVTHLLQRPGFEALARRLDLS